MGYGQGAGYAQGSGYGRAAGEGQAGGYPASGAAGYGRDSGRDQHQHRDRDRDRDRRRSRSRSRRNGRAVAAAPPRSRVVGGEFGAASNSSSMDVERIDVGRSSQDTISDIVEGEYFYVSENHGKAVWQRKGQVDGLNVLIYFWDDRDGPNFSGWWFGPRVGGDQVWAHHPDPVSRLPPERGWRIPYDGDVDPLFTMRYSRLSRHAVPQESAQRHNEPGGEFHDRDRRGYGRDVGGRRVASPGREVRREREDAERSRHEEERRRHDEDRRRQEEERRRWQEQEDKRRREEDRRRREEEDRRRAEDRRREDDRRRRHDEEDRRRRYEEEERRRRDREEERRRKEDERRREEDLRRTVEKQKQEQKRREEERQKAQREEIRAALECRRAIQDIISAQPEALLSTKKNSEEVLAREERFCGAGFQKIRRDFNEAVALAAARAVQAEKKKESDEMAVKLVADFSELVSASEVKNKALEEATKSLAASQEENFALAFGFIRESIQEVNDGLKACTDFVLTNKLSDIAQSLETQPSTREVLVKLLRRLKESSVMSFALDRAAQTARSSCLGRVAAKRELRADKAVFDKYDTNGDGALGMEDIARYAEAELNFELPAKPLARFYESIVLPDAPGADLSQFLQVRSFVGIARDTKMCEQKRVARIEREERVAREAEEHKKLVAAAQEKMQAKFDEIAEGRADLEKDVALAEEMANGLAEQDEEVDDKSLVEEVREVDALISQLNERIFKMKDKAESTHQHDLHGVAELKMSVQLRTREVVVAMNKLETRLQRAHMSASKCRDGVNKRAALVREKMRALVIGVLRRHMKEHSLSPEAQFDEIDSSGTGVATTLACATQVRQMSGGGDLDLEKLGIFFGELASGGSAREVSKDDFVKLLRVYFKVVNQTVVTAGLSIGGSKTLRRLVIGEVIEVIEEPQEDEAIGVQRLKGRAVRDGLTGWITVAGNQGTVYLEEGGNLYKVVRETALKDMPADMEEYAARLVRTLKVGELVEVIEWEKPDQSSTLHRIKGKAKSDGATGWTLTVDDQANVFLEML